MQEAATVRTPRGSYRVVLADHAVGLGAPWVLTLTVEHCGGLEKFSFRSRIVSSLLESNGITQPIAAASRMAGWIEREFERVREAALKSVRSERRLLELEFDDGQPGPFQPRP